LYNQFTNLLGTYVFSIYVKVSVANTVIGLYNAPVGSSTSGYEVIRTIADEDVDAQIGWVINATYKIPVANKWYRIGYVMRITDSVTCGFRAESTVDNVTLSVSAPMLETGSTLHDFVPYGGWIFHAHEGEYPINDKTAPTLQTTFKRPFPASLWRIDESNGGYPYHDLIPNIVHYVPREESGAFENAASLASVRVPMSVKAVGPTAFAGTALQRVRIAADCTYGAESFPEGCVVTRYPDDRYEQLYDSAGKAVLDYDARRIYVLKEDTNNG
jgi:hypothetical protein